MVKNIGKRVIFSIIILLILTFFVFFLSNMMQGNALDVALQGDNTMSQEAYNALLHEMGLDQPIPVRYWHWLVNFLHGDMGVSSANNRQVWDILQERIGPSLMLTGSAMIIAIIISLPLGIISAYKPYSIWDNIASFLSFIGAAMPGFLVCLFGIYIFSVRLGWAPSGGMYYQNQPHTVGALLAHLALPAILTGLQMIGSLIKQTRGAVLEVMNEDYIKTARSKGLSEFVVVIKHAFRNALIPIITTISLSIPWVVGGAVVVEKIFGWPGMGSLMVDSINNRDYNPIMGAAVIICAVVLASNLVLDIIYTFVDPRLAKEK